jgi:hypothetical protein
MSRTQGESTAKSSRLVRLCLCGSVFFFNLSGAFALDAILKSDASVNAAHGSSNYGALSNLYVGNRNTTFLQFDLTTLPAGTLSSQVSHATLIVFVPNGSYRCDWPRRPHRSYRDNWRNRPPKGQSD